MIISQRTIGSTIYAVADSGIDLPILPAGSLIVRTDSPNVYVSNGVSLVEITAVTGEPIEAANFASLPSDVDDGALGITTDTNDLYRKDSGDWRLILGAERANASTLPVTNIETDALILVDGKPFAYGGTKWENPIVDLSTWSSRPKNVPDGTWGVGPNGRVYRYFSSSGPGEWIDPRVYATATFRCKITGDVTPDNETPSWGVFTDGGGSVTSNGTRVRFDGNFAGDVRAFASVNHGQSGASVGMYMCGYYTSSGTLLGQGVSFWAENGVRTFQIGTGASTANGWLLYPNLTGTAATAGEVLGSGTERWVELRADVNGAYLWVDHKLVGWRQAAFFDATALIRFAIGEVAMTVTRGILDVREVLCLTYTI